MNNNSSRLAKQLFEDAGELADLLIPMDDEFEQFSSFTSAVTRTLKLIVTNQPLALNILENATKNYLPEIRSTIEKTTMLDKSEHEQALLIHDKINQTVTDLIEALNPQEQNDKTNDSGISISCQS